MSAAITRAERDQLSRLVRQRARVAKAGIEQRQAELLADVEEQLAAAYASDHEAWAEITAEAKEAIRRADAAVAEKCRELGIREEFRPSIRMDWWSRGENGSRERRQELRKVAQTRIAALAKAAKVQIDRDALERETELVAGALTSAEAKAFLESMPTVEALMPPLALAELERPT